MTTGKYEAAKNQFRSAWVGTILNLHFPQTASEEDFHAEYRKVLDTYAALNMNAVLFQVRPEQDAWYPSNQGNPWSKYLTTRAAQGSDPGFDPLEAMVSMSHNAGLEYHAWLNPYRVTITAPGNLPPEAVASLAAAGFTVADLENASAQEHVRIYVAAGLLAPDNFAARHPQWVLKFDNRLFLNPAVPEVRQHIVDTVAEIVDNYDVDGIHFDDYFYPNGFGAKNADPVRAADRAEFARFGRAFPQTTDGLNDWRRANTTALVQDVRGVIDERNAKQGRSVKFGISPAGVWNHAQLDPRGTDTPLTVSSTYGDLFADTYAWVQDKLVDYVIPQLYWTFSDEDTPYGQIARWWNKAVEGTGVHLYIGHGNYNIAPSSAATGWANHDEVPSQLRFNQDLQNVGGAGLYSYGDLVKSGANDNQRRTREIIESYWENPALLPAVERLSRPVTSPAEVQIEGPLLTWTDPDPKTSRFFIVYRGTGTKDEIIANPASIIERMWAGKGPHFQFDLEGYEGGREIPKNVKWLVTTVNGAGDESVAVQAKKN